MAAIPVGGREGPYCRVASARLAATREVNGPVALVMAAINPNDTPDMLLADPTLCRTLGILSSA